MQRRTKKGPAKKRANMAHGVFVLGGHVHGWAVWGVLVPIDGECQCMVPRSTAECIPSSFECA